MSLLRAIFGPSKDEIWSRIADEIGGEYIKDEFWKSGGVRFRHEEWEILLDTYTVSNGKHSSSYTRMRAPFVNKDKLYVKIYRNGFFAGIGRFFGMQDLVIGDDYFDKKFIIKGNNPKKIKTLLSDDRLRRLIDMQPHISLEIRDDEGWFGNEFPDGVDLVVFQCGGVIKDTQKLKALFYLFSLLLERLVQIDSAYENDPGLQLK